MADYQIVPASPRHVRPLARRLRGAASASLEAFGFDPRRALHDVFCASHYSRTAIIDGVPAAMWGAAGTLLGEAVSVWLVLADEAGRIPGAVVREARRELAALAEDYAEVGATVLPDDPVAMRFAAFLGFKETGERIPVGDRFVVEMRLKREIN